MIVVFFVLAVQMAGQVPQAYLGPLPVRNLGLECRPFVLQLSSQLLIRDSQCLSVFLVE